MGAFLIFRLEEQYCGIDLDCVETVVPAAQLVPYRGGSEATLGLLNFHGTMVPVFNTRKLLELKERGLEISDQLILCRIGKKMLALLADRAIEVKDLSKELAEQGARAEDLFSCIRFAVNVDGKVIFILSQDALMQHYPAQIEGSRR